MSCCCCNKSGCATDAASDSAATSTVVLTPASGTSETNEAEVNRTPSEGDEAPKGEEDSTEKKKEKKDGGDSDDEDDSEDEDEELPMKPEMINLITRYDQTSGEFITKPATANTFSKRGGEYSDYALTLTSAFSIAGNFTRKLVEIKAPVLKKLCFDVIGDNYTGQSFKTEHIIMNCPPKPLFHYREEFEQEAVRWKNRLTVLKQQAKEEKAKAEEEKAKAEEEKAKVEEGKAKTEEEKVKTEEEKAKAKEAEAGERGEPEASKKKKEDGGNAEDDKTQDAGIDEENSSEDEEADDDTPLTTEARGQIIEGKALEEKTLEELKEDMKYINLFLRFIRTELRGEISAYNSLTPQGLISYDILWTIFPPHTKFLVYTHNNEPSLYTLHKGVLVTGGCNPRFHLDCFNVDHDGYNFGYAQGSAGIPPFEGVLPIASLPAVPLKYLPNADHVVEELVARGRKSEKHQAYGPSYMTYKGRALGPILDERRTFYSINGRVMIDPNTFGRMQPDRAISVTTLQASHSYQGNGDDWYNGRDAYENGYGGVVVELDGEAKHEPIEKTATRTGNFYIPLTDEQASMVHPFVRGFALAEKKWAEFAVGSLSEVQWVPDAFDKLVLPEAQKELILSLVEAPTASGAVSEESKKGGYRFDDFIPTKGLGLVAVLHGPPGVGKTLTAESVAEYTRRPLYSVTTGELGTEPSELEHALAEILDVAGTWNAILLIDEADIFLESRGSSGLGDGIKRNAMVGIFLRLLEYFRGIMFLTTNRVEQFDPAFKSRIHLAMRYKDLTEEARVEVWRNFVGKVPGELVEVDLLETVDGQEPGVMILARTWSGVNGREIKNAVKTGLRIAGRREAKLSRGILEGVLQLGGEFDAQVKLSGN